MADWKNCGNILLSFFLRFLFFIWGLYFVKKIQASTVVGDYINIMKITFDFNFDLYQAFKQHGYTKTWKQREAVN